jgi:cytochrome b subunit of formate dehydrogenase
MPPTSPYQPLLLRILHNISGILVIAAIITGFLVYNTYDGRFGKIPIPQIADIQGIHGTFGLLFLLLLPAFAIYSFHAGKKRLIQPDALQQLTQFGKPILWLSLQRLANTLMLFAAVFAVISGRMMKEEWLPAGKLDQTWYYIHLTAWLVMICCLAIHLLMSVKVGGAPLLLSMTVTKFRPEESPARWYSRIRGWFSNLPANLAQENSNFLQNHLSLKILELIILVGIVAAFVLPAFFSGENS